MERVTIKKTVYCLCDAKGKCVMYCISKSEAVMAKRAFSRVSDEIFKICRGKAVYDVTEIVPSIEIVREGDEND